MSKYWLLLLLLLPLGVNAQKADFGSEAGSTTVPIEIPIDQLPPSISPLYEVVAIPTDIIVPEKEGENITLRTENTEVYLQQDGSTQYKIYALPIYHQDQEGFFTKEIDYQYQLKPTAIRAKNWQDELFNFFFKAPLAFAQTFYPQAGDGIVSNYNVVNWNTAHDAATGNYVNYTGTTYSDAAMTGAGYLHHAANVSLSRIIIPFNTSTITDDDNILTASLWLKTNYESNTNCNLYYNISTSTPASSASLTTADFDQVPNTGLDLSTDVQESSLASAGNWQEWVFNSTGTSTITKTGTSSYAVRLANDIDDSDPACIPNSGTYYEPYASEQTGTTDDPYLLITTSSSTPTSTTTATATSCDMTAGTLDDDTIATYLLYWYYVILMFVILTIGYSLVDRIFHLFKGKR